VLIKQRSGIRICFEGMHAILPSTHAGHCACMLSIPLAHLGQSNFDKTSSRKMEVTSDLSFPSPHITIDANRPRYHHTVYAYGSTMVILDGPLVSYLLGGQPNSPASIQIPYH